MVKLGHTHKNLVAVTAAMPEGTGLIEFSKTFPNRFFDVGIAEQHAVTFSAGLASKGSKPVVAIYSTFLQRAFDQILHDVCIDAHPVIFAIDRGGIVGEDGPTHHGLFDYAYLRCMPNMVIMAPKDENELTQMMITAVNHDGPCAIRYPRGSGTGVDLSEHPQPIEIGKGELLSDGNNLLIIAIGNSVNEAKTAVRALNEKGFNPAFINARFVKPLDNTLIIEHAIKTKNIITVEEHVLDGGFGSAVLEMLIDNNVSGFCLKRIGIADKFVEHGPQAALRKDYGIDHATILSEALTLLGK